MATTSSCSIYAKQAAIGRHAAFSWRLPMKTARLSAISLHRKNWPLPDSRPSPGWAIITWRASMAGSPITVFPPFTLPALLTEKTRATTGSSSNAAFPFVRTGSIRKAATRRNSPMRRETKPGPFRSIPEKPPFPFQSTSGHPIPTACCCGWNMLIRPDSAPWPVCACSITNP